MFGIFSFSKKLERFKMPTRRIVNPNMRHLSYNWSVLTSNPMVLLNNNNNNTGVHKVYTFYVLFCKALSNFKKKFPYNITYCVSSA